MRTFKSIRNFSSSVKQRVTFIGLGNMGYNMGANLALSGKYLVSGFDVNKEVEDKFNKQENTVKKSFEDSCKESDIFVTMLPNTDIVKSTANQILNNSLKKQVVFVDSSTICPIESKVISKSFETKGHIAADAPVSGGVVGAQKGTLTFMVGCDAKSYELYKAFLSSMGANFFHCGEHGTGQIAKLCNNLLLGITTAGLSESLALGKNLGIDDKVLANIIKVSSGYCWSLNVNCPVPGVIDTAASSRNYERGFNMELMAKDMNLAKDSAKTLGQELPIGSVAGDYYNELTKKGKGKSDFSYVYQYLLNNKKV